MEISRLKSEFMVRIMLGVKSVRTSSGVPRSASAAESQEKIEMKGRSSRKRLGAV